MRKQLISLALLVVAAPMQAHETWAMARAAGDRQVSVQLTHGAVFPGGQHAGRQEHLASAKLLPEGKLEGSVDLVVGERQGSYLPMQASVGAAAWAIAAVTLKSSDITLSDEEVEEYLVELGNPVGLRPAWETSGQWRERFQKHAKALVRLKPGRATAETMDAGMLFEFIPMQDPTTLRPGQILDFRLEYRDQPLANHRVGIVYANSHGEVWSETNAEGYGRFNLAHPGWALLRSVRIEPSDDAQLDWESHFTTLVFEIRHPELAEQANDAGEYE